MKPEGEQSAASSSSFDYDAIIVGGGFFGCSIALELARQGQRTLILERNHDLMQRASYTNQARVHGGYHYPRSLLTALRSRINLPIFSRDYQDCIERDFKKYYAIARQFSKVSSQQFELFCRRIEAPIYPAPRHIKQLFNSDLIEDVFEVQEYAFNSTRLKQRLQHELDQPAITVLTHTQAQAVGRSGAGLHLQYQQADNSHTVTARQIYNCTYAQINELNRRSHLPEINLKHEIAEVALIEPPAELADLGVTVMCGPFFSTMPFPARSLYSLTHVRYTPHTEWREPAPDGHPASYDYLQSLPLRSAYPKMLADAQRYLPCLSASRYVESLYEVKTVLPQSESDDSRPILFRRNHGLPGYTCVMGGKLDNIYDVFKELSIA